MITPPFTPLNIVHCIFRNQSSVKELANSLKLKWNRQSKQFLFGWFVNAWLISYKILVRIKI